MAALPPPAVSQWAVSGCRPRRVLPSNKPTLSPPVPETEKPVGFGSFGVVWEVTNPRDGHRVALKRMTNVFDSVTAARRVVRELKMLFFLKHDNVLSALDVVSPTSFHFMEVYVLSELMMSDLHKIIFSHQALTDSHIKLFLYQILRGMKYLHSAGILHRDLKPGNLLVNWDCSLKICDFGLARMIATDSSAMTQEVVTQYYRAPEILAGCSHYNSAIDVWSIGCIFAELLGRSILFRASNPMAQLDDITDLLGTPTPEELHCACPEARMHILKQKKKDQLSRLNQLSSFSTHEAVHLLCRFLVFDPKGRISCLDALSHPYLDEGRLYYHTSLCSCCHTRRRLRVYSKDLEPSSCHLFDSSYEDSIMSVTCLRHILWQFIHNLNPDKPPLFINPSASVLPSFFRSTPGKPPETP